MIIAFGNSLTSFFAGFVVFSILGNMAHERGLPVPDVVQPGTELFFIIILISDKRIKEVS